VDVGLAEADRLARLQVEALAILGVQPDDVDFELPGRP
jgi:hypothetical protein